MKKNKPVVEVNELSVEQKTSVKVRTITGLILAAILIPGVILGSYFFAIVVFLVAGFGAYEIVAVSSIKKSKFKILIYIFTISLVESFVFWVLIKNNFQALSESKDVFATFDSILTNDFNKMYFSVFAFILGAGFYFIISFLDEEVSIQTVFYYIAMTMIVGVCAQSCLFLRQIPSVKFGQLGIDINSADFRFFQSWLLFVYLVIGVFGNDIFAFFTGILFGKHKVNPRISPKKTWEGFAGGLICSTILSFGFAMILSAVGRPIFPLYDIEHWYYILAVSLMMPIVGDIGDFVFSAIKRGFGIKDFSNLLPGHGGMLDRMDSLFFGAAAVAIFTVMISNGWNFMV